QRGDHRLLPAPRERRGPAPTAGPLAGGGGPVADVRRRTQEGTFPCLVLCQASGHGTAVISAPAPAPTAWASCQLLLHLERLPDGEESWIICESRAETPGADCQAGCRLDAGFLSRPRSSGKKKLVRESGRLYMGVMENHQN